MSALMDITNGVGNNSKGKRNNIKDELILLLKSKIEDSIVNDRSIIIGISSSMMDCRNTINVEDYEINKNYLYLNCENFEIHISLNDTTQITYVSEEDSEEYFILKQKDKQITIYFI